MDKAQPVSTEKAVKELVLKSGASQRSPRSILKPVRSSASHHSLLDPQVGASVLPASGPLKERSAAASFGLQPKIPSAKEQQPAMRDQYQGQGQGHGQGLNSENIFNTIRQNTSERPKQERLQKKHLLSSV